MVNIRPICGLVACLATVSAMGDGPSESDVRAWFDREMARPAMSFPQTVIFKYDQVNLPAVDDSTLARWRREVEGKPEHPYRRDILAEERLRKAGSVRTTTFACIRDQDHWRLSADFEATGGSRDTVRNGERSWQLSDGLLKLFDEESRRGGVGQVFENNWVMLRGDLDLFLHGGLLRLTRFNAPTIKVSVDGTSWGADVGTASGHKWRYSGIWDADRSEGRVLKLAAWDPGKADPWNTVIFSEHRFVDAVGSVVAHSVLSDSPGLAKARFEIREIALIDPSTRTRLLAAPDPLGTDAMRGDLKVQRVDDYGNGAVTSRDLKSGSASTFDAGPTAGEDSWRGTWLRPLGWAVLACLAGMFVYLRKKG